MPWSRAATRSGSTSTRFPVPRHHALRRPRADRPWATDDDGNYRALLRLFGIPHTDYKRFHNFLMTHGCKVDFRNYRTGVDLPTTRPAALLKIS